MLVDTILLIVGLILVLISAELYTNSVEFLGYKFSLSEAVVGSILAAVGTALPETILPLVAIFMDKGRSSHAIAIGAILGAPFMLATLGFFITGFAAILGYLRKKRQIQLNIEIDNTKKDIVFFLMAFGSAILLPTLNINHILICLLILIIYVIYVLMTLKSTSKDIELPNELMVKKLIKNIVHIGNSTILGLFQLFASLAMMVLGANEFVNGIERISTTFGFNPLVFSLLVAPMATELPEKFNSFLWTMRSKDNLALSNITGAMVFQSTFPVAVGLIFTTWTLTSNAIMAASITFFSSLVVLCSLLVFKKINGFFLSSAAFLYILYVILVL